MKRLITISIFLIFNIILFAETADEIINKIEEKEIYSNGKMIMRMKIYNDIESSDFREMKILSYSDNNDKAYMEFISPPSIKGLKILSLGNDQWIYFASTGRVKKIAAKSKDKSIKGVGGDFSYEDFSSGDMKKKYSFSLIENKEKEWIIQGIPKENSSYSKILILVEKETYRINKIEYYSEKDGHIKDLIMEDYRIENEIDMANKMVMINLKKGSKTEIILEEVELNIDIPSKYFNSNKFYK